ncbi:uncharacterized protein septin12 [Polymixia lowei]
MSEFSVNDHLEGILSDFEALKRSFDIDDVDDIPTFSSASPVSSPISPSSPRLLLGNNKANEGRGGGGVQSASAAFNNSHLGSVPYHARIGPGSNPGPALKSRTLVSSVSFNRGTMNKPALNNNNNGTGGVTRAASFQNRFNPNGYFSSTLSGPGSDNDSLHSSSSSLEYSGGGGGGGGGLPPMAKLGSYASPPPPGEYHRPQPQLQQQPAVQQQRLGGGAVHTLKKFSSHGSVFHSELDEVPGMSLGCVPEPRGVSHGSMPSLDLQMGDGGGEMADMRRGGGGMSPGLRYANANANANWNGRSHNAGALGKEGYYGSNNQNHSQPQSPQALHAFQPKVKETPRLNKFPLDLDSLVGSTSTTKSQVGALSPNPPKPPPRSTGVPQLPAGPPSASTSPSASISSLDSSSDTPPLSLHHPISPFISPAHSQGSIPVPEVSRSPVPLSPAQTPQLQLLSGPQVVRVAAPGPSGPRAARPLEEAQGEAKDSVGSILQRIASFSRSAATDVAPATVTPPPRALSNGVKRDDGGFPMLVRQDCVVPAEAEPTPVQRQWKKKMEDTAKVLETGTPTPMEESEGKESAMEQEEQGESEVKAQTPTDTIPDTNAPNSVKTNQENSLEVKMEEEEEEEAGMEKHGLNKETEVEIEVVPPSLVCQAVPGLQMGYIRGSDLFGYVGIEAVLDQMRRKTMKAGFEFNIMVVGQSGLGKSTLVNTLFKSKVSRKSCTPNYEEKISKTVKLQSVSHVIEEKGVKMKLTVIDTPGFGDQINNENCWEPIVTYVNEQYEKYLREELHVNRKRRIPDARVHCCVYFLPATGHWLRPIDVEFMKRLGKIVSIVPVIAKADTLTIEERLEFKQRIRQDLVANGIRVYPQKEYDEDAEDRIRNDRIRESIPFAVVGTDKEHQVNGNKVLGRKTKWGIIEVENVAHCEFANLRDLLIRSHLQDLKDVTHNIHYETYRVRRLNESNMNVNGLALSTHPLENGTSDKSESESHL